MRFSDWSSDVCSSDLRRACGVVGASLGIDAELERQHHLEWRRAGAHHISEGVVQGDPGEAAPVARAPVNTVDRRGDFAVAAQDAEVRSGEHTSELQSLMRISYAVFCLKNKKHTNKPY